MAGEIHGLINREDAWRMWAPYGERMTVGLDSELDPDSITADEAICIIAGAPEDDMATAYGFWYDENDDREDWLAGLRELIKEDRAPQELKDLLVSSNQAQLSHAKALRAEWLNNKATEVLKLLGKGARILSQEGLLTPSQSDKVHEFLLAPDGSPALQYTPMTYLEIQRFYAAHENGTKDPIAAAAMDPRFGAITHGTFLRETMQTHNNSLTVHEYVHGSYSGWEIYDVTRIDNWRYPLVSVSGLQAELPTTEVYGSDDYEGTDNIEANEGWTEFIAQNLMRVVPELGIYHETPDDPYLSWATTVKRLHATQPELYRRITASIFSEATVQQPHAKRHAMADLFEYADNLLGAHDALNKLFQANGGKITDLYKKG